MSVLPTWHPCVVSLILASVSAVVAAQLQAPDRAPDLEPYLMADRAAEVALARSAAPKAISGDATVLALTRAGYVEAARGTNGFTCLVVRSFEGSLDDTSTWWNPRIRAPHCLNPAAVRAILPEMEQRTALVMARVPVREIVTRIKRGYATHAFIDPQGGAMAYMMSRDQYLSDEAPHVKPHVMFYFGGGRKASEWGAGDMRAPVIDGGTEPASGIIVIMIPVPQWSDGTPSASR